jgi:hypothetical protein
MPEAVRRATWCLVCIAASFLADLSAAYGKPPTRYAELRSALLSSGWRPRIVVVVFTDGGREWDWGDARVMFESGFVEIERCTGVERNFCFFNFRKGRMCKRVTTAGELNRDGSSPPAPR